MPAHPAPRWRSEPFRVLFPLGIVLAWVGVGHWLLYWSGLRATYSCETHGLMQLEGFMPAFAAGFLLTAVPRRTAAPPASATTVGLVALGLVAAVAAGTADRRAAMQVAYLAVWATLLAFAVPRLLGAGAARRPPASFVLVPIGALHGIAGAALLLREAVGAGGPSSGALGRLLVEQGVFLCLSLGVGGLFYPLVSGSAPPADLDAGPRERRRLGWIVLAGAAIFATLVAEALGSERAAPLARAIVVVVGLVAAVGAHRRPGRPGLNRQLVWAALWLEPAGLALSAALPTLRVPALHVTFIGGFSLLVLAVGAHVALSHGGREAARDRTPWPVPVWATGIALALLARLAADWSNTYFDHLASAAIAWIAGSGVWLAFVAPALVAGAPPPGGEAGP